MTRRLEQASLFQPEGSTAQLDLNALLAQAKAQAGKTGRATASSDGPRKPPKSPKFTFPIKPSEYDSTSCYPGRRRSPCDKAAVSFQRATERWLQGVVDTIVGHSHDLTATPSGSTTVDTTRRSSDDPMRAWIPSGRQAIVALQHMNVHPKDRNDQWGDPYVTIYVVGTAWEHRGWIRWGMTPPEYPPSATGTVEGHVDVKTNNDTMSDWLRAATDESVVELRDWLVKYARKVRS